MTPGNPTSVRSNIRKRQEDFFAALLDHIPEELGAYLKSICRAWQTVSGAEWVWLWLYNAGSDTFRLSQSFARDPLEEETGSILPTSREAPGATSVGMYCVRRGEPILVDGDAREWAGRIGDTTYAIATADSLVEMGAVGFDAVPLLLPGRNHDESPETTVGVMSLHWRNLDVRKPFARYTKTLLLQHMARLTALAIRSCQLMEQRAILVELNRMAQRFASRTTRRPADVRADYLKSLIRLIKERLHVAGVSVFYRAIFGNTINCIASTGLRSAKGDPLPDSALGDASYESFEGLTGCCYGSSEMLVVLRPDLDRRWKGKYCEIRRVTAGLREEDPVAYVPIPAPPDSESKSKAALGVIRCVEHLSAVFPDRLSPWFPTELQTLGFIAEQVAPVLQTFAQRIERERGISIVRHELATPLSMVRDGLHDLAESLKNDMPLGEHELDDIAACNYVALNLVKQLDPEPTTVGELESTPTYFEADIVARLRSMLRRYAWVTNAMNIQYEGLRNIPKLNIDRMQIERAIANLLLNAIKYGEKGSTIQVRGERTPEGYHVHVSNAGVGVAVEDLPYIFKPGFRSPKTKHRAPGMGLGLAITREIMRAHGGGVRLSSPRGPTTFSLFFPKSLEVVG